MGWILASEILGGLFSGGIIFSGGGGVGGSLLSEFYGE